jgi:hypothetical protein
MEKLVQAQEAYGEIGQLFLEAANRMDARLLSEIESGIAQEFWQEELKHALYKAKPHFSIEFQ